MLYLYHPNLLPMVKYGLKSGENGYWLSPLQEMALIAGEKASG
jgi:hypothetical protein